MSVWPDNKGIIYISNPKCGLKWGCAQAVKRGDPKNGIAVHAHKTQHGIDWNGAQVKKMETNYWKRRTIEAIQIKISSETMNLDSGLQLPSVWNPILNPP